MAHATDVRFFDRLVRLLRKLYLYLSVGSDEVPNDDAKSVIGTSTWTC